MTKLEELPDMAEVIETCKTKIDAIDDSLEVSISDQNSTKMLEAYRELNAKHTISLVGKHTFVIKTGDIKTGEQTRHISIQEMPVLSILADNLRALEAYRKVLDEVAREMGFSSRVGDGSKFFGAMPGED